MSQETGNLFHSNHPRNVIPALTLDFQNRGWFSGSSGAVSIKQGDSIYLPPSTIPKDKLDPLDFFVMKKDGSISQSPSTDKNLVPISSAPLLLNAFQDRDAGAVIQSHGKFVILASMICPGTEFKISNVELVKGIYNPVQKRMLKLEEDVTVPIIENTSNEKTLRQKMKAAMKKYPESSAVIVRKHGIFVWADTWQQCKAMAEHYHYFCELAVEMHKLGLAYIPPTDVSLVSSVVEEEEQEEEETEVATVTESNKTEEVAPTTSTEAVASTSTNAKVPNAKASPVKAAHNKKGAKVINGSAKNNPLALQQGRVTKKVAANKKNNANQNQNNRWNKQQQHQQQMQRRGPFPMGPPVWAGGHPMHHGGPPMMNPMMFGGPPMMNPMGFPNSRMPGRGGNRGGARGGVRGAKGGARGGKNLKGPGAANAAKKGNQQQQNKGKKISQAVLMNY